MNKICTKCQTNKSLTNFSKDKRQKYGRRPECKVCEHQRPSYLYKSLRTRLKQSKWHTNIKNNLTVNDVANLERVCYFCKQQILDGASIHRLDHSKDYTTDNVVLVHKSCHAVFGQHNKGQRKRG